MKYFKRLGIYKASNVTFDSAAMVAVSYGWWVFVARIGGKVVFNNYFYSQATRGHQRKVRNQLERLGIAIDLEIAAPRGLQFGLADSINYYLVQNATIKDRLDFNKTRLRQTIKDKLTHEYAQNVLIIDQLTKLIQAEEVKHAS